ncbi:MDR family MFS transporter [Bacillus solitudinis]|uniref:MDR family MFS transporter n=1 Tax=Bacillus solitudinis TaxID=2014074 RepID=UPI000C24604A|nr:MDR family MFS transporter [Bacillus solitudinis]
MHSVQTQEQPTSHQEENVKVLPIMMSLIIGAFFAILNETLLTVAFTDLIKELQVSAATIQWLSTGFLLVVGILIPVSALIIQWFTTRQIFLGAMILFTIGTIICGFSPNFSFLLFGRIIQAAGTGLLIPVLMNTVLVLYPPEKRGGAMGMIGLVIMFAPAIGPTISGVIVESLNWRWLFYIVIPMALLSILFASIYLKNVTPVTKPKVDIISIILSTLGFGGIVFGFSFGGEGEGGFLSFSVIVTLLVGVISLILFVVRQLKLPEPVLDVRAFKSPMFALTTVLIIIMMMTMFSTMIIIPMFLQGGLALSAYVAGLALLPGGILNGFLSPISGRLFDKFGPRSLIIPGSALVVVVMWMFTNVSHATSLITFITLHTLLMIGIALVMTPGQTNGLNQLPRKYYPHGTAIINTLVQIGGAVGIAFFISIMTAGQLAYLDGATDPTPAQQSEALISGVQAAFSVGLIFAIIGFVITLFITRSVPPTEA